MKKIIILTSLFILIIGSTFFIFAKQQKSPIIKSEENNLTISQSSMKITSSAFEHNQNIPSKYTCDGENVNPALKFEDIPANAQSLALKVDDPDAPSKTWDHWVVFNINPSAKEIAENSTPQEAVEAMTDFGRPGYGGPCPPSGTHRYFFKLYALDISLNLDLKATKADVEKAMQGHILAQTELIGLYKRM